MKAGELSRSAFLNLLKNEGIAFRTGPFIVHLRSNIPTFGDTWRDCYPSLELIAGDPISHFHVSVVEKKGIRSAFRPQASFQIAGMEPFDPYPLSHAFPMFEWGLNWCIGTMAHKYLLLHSAVIEKNGRAVIMPAQPGSGKSTLCVGMTSRGWRLLSDEFGILDTASGNMIPLPRAAPLKNASIDVIAQYAPSLRLGPHFDKTRKGTVSHLFPNAGDLARQAEPASPALVVFPRYVPNADLEIVDQPRPVALTRLVNNSFNYLIKGESGFQALSRLMMECRCVQLSYSNLDDAIEALDEMLVTT